MEVYYYRNKTNKPVVKVHDAEFTKEDSMCTNDKNISVYSDSVKV